MSLAYIELSVTNTKQAAFELEEKAGVQSFEIFDQGEIRIYDHGVSTQELAKVLFINDVDIVAMGKRAETLEDYFLKLTAEKSEYE